MTTETSTGTGTSPSNSAGWRSDLFNYTRLSSTQLSHYHEQGYLVIKSLLSAEGRRTMVDECMRAWVSEKGPYDPSANWLSNALLANIHHQSQAVRDYYFNGPLVDIAEQIIGPNLKGVTSQLTFKMRGHTKGFAWHQDNGYGELEPYNAVTCLTALEDNDEQTGCLWVLPESHKLGQIRPGLTATQKLAGHEVVIHPDESKARPLPLEAGDCLIFPAGCCTNPRVISLMTKTGGCCFCATQMPTQSRFTTVAKPDWADWCAATAPTPRWPPLRKTCEAGGLNPGWTAWRLAALG